MPKEVLSDLPTRLRRAAADVADTRGAHLAALEIRDGLVVEACDGGMTQLRVAELIGVRKGRISRILAGSQPEDDDE